MPVRRRRGAERRFCTTPCRRAFDKATRKLGQETADEKFPAPGALRSRSGEARALNEGVKSDDLVSDTVKDAPARPERPEAALYSFVQFGHFWFVTDPDGRRISEPLKTPGAAQRRARLLSEDGDKTPHEPKS